MADEQSAKIVALTHSIDLLRLERRRLLAVVSMTGPDSDSLRVLSERLNVIHQRLHDESRELFDLENEP